MIFDGVYNLLATTLFNSSVPYADLLCTLSSGFVCLGLVYLCFTPVFAIFKLALKWLGIGAF